MNWRDIPGHAGYQVSDTGQVRNSRTGHVLKPQAYPNEYVGVQLGKGPRYLVHRLVAIAFIPGDQALQVNHKNGKRDDNRAINLEWVSCSENHRHSYRELSRKAHALTRTVELMKDGASHTFASGLDAAKHLGVCAGSVASAALHHHKCKGFEVRYA